jgi:hypothetical protein
VDDHEAVLSTSEKVVVVKTESHSLNGLAMSLDLTHLRQLWQLVNLNSAWLAIFAYTTDKRFLVACKADLLKGDAGLEAVLRLLRVPDLPIVANSKHLKRLARNVND